MDYLPKITVVYFLCVRRGTWQHQLRDTNTGGGGCCHHSKLISYPHVFFSPKFSYFLYQSFNFFILLSCVVMTLNISLIRIVYCIQSCMSLMSSLLFTNIKKNLFFLVEINDKLCTIKVAILCYVHSYLLSQLLIIIYKHNIDNTELLLLMVLRIVIEAADYTMCEYISSQYQTICNIVFRRLSHFNSLLFSINQQ